MQVNIRPHPVQPIGVTSGQILYEREHLLIKLSPSSPVRQVGWHHGSDRTVASEFHSPMSERITVRPILRTDYDEWRTLWDGYNTFYGRSGETALAEEVTRSTWERFFTPSEAVHAFVAEDVGTVVGLTHYLFHRSTTRLENVCYLQDLFTTEHLRGRGVGRRLIQAVYEAAQAAGSSRVYWHTQTSNEAGRRLYDKVAKHSGFILYSHEW